MRLLRQIAEGCPARGWLLGAIALAALVRLPFWILAWRAPVDADTAIVGLMARHFGLFATFLGQPYGSPLESWLLLPAVALGAGPASVRVLYFALSLSLIPLAFALGRRIDRRAGMPAALLVACPPAYALLIAAFPPPLYPVTLALGGLLLLVALELRRRHEHGEPVAAITAAWGALAGLALWTHLMVASAVLAGLICLAPILLRRRAALLVLALGLLATSSTLWLRALADGQIFTVVRLSSPRVSWSEHVLDLLPRLHRPLGGLLGAGVPLVADLEQRVDAPAWVAAPLAILWTALASLGAWRARGAAAGRLAIGAALLTLVFFLIPLRSDVHTIRFLTPLYLPLAAIAGAALAAGGALGRAALVATLALHALSATPLYRAWRAADRARAPYFTPDLEPTRRFLQDRGIQHAFASYEAAYRLTFESGEALIVSQPWNERFPRFPLPYLEDVRSAGPVAWVLTPGIPSELPSPDAFEAELRRSGGSWRRERAGGAVVFFDFVPPQDPSGDAASAISWVNGHPELRPGRWATAPPL